MKKLIFAFVALAFLGCDSPTRPNDPIPKTVKRTIVSSQIVSKNVVFRDSSVIVGSIQDKDTKSGTGVVVCSELMNKCARTNSKGIYSISPSVARPVSLLAARSSAEGDTVTTPENVETSFPVDTTFDTTQTIVSDTIETDSSISIVDSVVTEIVQTVSTVDTVSVDDTLTVVSNGTILREIPIDSWGFILPPNYIVQRDISALDSTYDGAIKSVEVVYFMTGDSIAKVLTLGNSGGKYFSGFIYTYYDSLSFKNDSKIYNLFVRGLDSARNVIVKTEIEMFSERFGDLQTKILKTKVGVPQWKIVPKMVPAAKNNKKLKDAVSEYRASEDTTINWVGLNNLPVVPRYATNGDSSNWWTLYSFTRAQISTILNNYDSVSATVVSSADSAIIFNQFRTPNGNFIKDFPSDSFTYKVKIYDAALDGLLYEKNVEKITTISNIRFYLKP